MKQAINVIGLQRLYLEEGVLMARKSKPIKVFTHYPANGAGKAYTDKILVDFYVRQVEKNIESLPWEYKRRVLQSLIEHFNGVY